MQPRRNSTLIYGLLLGVWVLVVAWQVEEHVRVRDAARTGLRNRSKDIANTLGAVVRARLRFRGAVSRDRLEPVLGELVVRHTNGAAIRRGDFHRAAERRRRIGRLCWPAGLIWNQRTCFRPASIGVCEDT